MADDLDPARGIKVIEADREIVQALPVRPQDLVFLDVQNHAIVVEDENVKGHIFEGVGIEHDEAGPPDIGEGIVGEIVSTVPVPVEGTAYPTDKLKGG